MKQEDDLSGFTFAGMPLVEVVFIWEQGIDGIGDFLDDQSMPSALPPTVAGRLVLTFLEAPDVEHRAPCLRIPIRKVGLRMPSGALAGRCYPRLLLAMAQGRPDRCIEPSQVSRRLQLLRGWSHDKTKQVFTGGERARSADALVLPPLSVGEIDAKTLRCI